MRPSDAGVRADTEASPTVGVEGFADAEFLDGGRVRPSSTRIHLVSNDAKLRSYVSVLLMNYCYLVTDADVAMAANEDSSDETRDLLIVDSADSTPETVRSVVERLASPRVRGVVVVTGADEDEIPSRLLGDCVDVLLPRPVEARQLLACVRGLMRRRSGLPAETKISAGWLTLWPERGTAAFGRREVELTHAENQLLKALIAKAGSPVSRLRLLQQIAHGSPDDRSLSRHVYRIREKIGNDAEGRSPIRTVRGVGYMLDREAQPGLASRG